MTHNNMQFVYFLRSQSAAEETYIGYTNSLFRRLNEHNNGDVGYTTRYRPWNIEAFVLTIDKDTAEVVERYFKNSSGREKFDRYKDSNPESQNVRVDYFQSLEVGKSFGRGENRFKVIDNLGVPVFSLVNRDQ